MAHAELTKAQQIAHASLAFEERRTGHAPKAVTVVLRDTTLLITLHGALSPAERTLAQSTTGAAQMQEYHRRLFVSAASSLGQEIKRITGVAVREAVAEVEPTTGSLMHAFTTGTVVQLFLLDTAVASETWSASSVPEPTGLASLPKVEGKP